MKLSFVIPAYNEEEHLAACLQSVQESKLKAKADAKRYLDWSYLGRSPETKHLLQEKLAVLDT